MKDRLKALLSSQGKTQTQLASYLGFSRAGVNRWFTTDGLPKDSSTLQKIADFFNVTPSYLLFGSEDSEKRSIECEDGFVLIPALDVAASCGGGAQNETEILVKIVKVAKAWLRNHAPYSNFSSLNIISAKGDSMSPTAEHGDMVVLDTSIRSFQSDSLYVFLKDGELFMKRIQRVADGVRVISDNSLYPPYDIPKSLLDTVKVIGKVCIVGKFSDY